MLDVLTYAASKKYTDEALAGGGAQQGKSAYEIAVEKGFKGTEEEWLASLKGDQGPVGPDNVYVGEQTPPPTGAKVKINPKGRKVVIPEFNDQEINRKDGWTSKQIVDTLCPSFEQTGPVVTCNPVVGYPLSVKSQIVPRQEGSGDPSPENVRPILPTKKVELTRCGENIAEKPVLSQVSVNYGSLVSFKAGEMPKVKLPIGTVISITLTAESETQAYWNPGCSVFNGVITFAVKSGTHRYSVRTNKENIIGLGESAPVLSKGGSNDGILITPSDFMISVDSSDYTPYTGETFTAQLPPDTYGGEVDWMKKSAVLLETYIFDGSPDEKWNFFDYGRGVTGWYTDRTNGSATYFREKDAYCNWLKNSRSSYPDNHFYTSDGLTINVMCSAYKTENEWLNQLKANPLVFVYAVKDPVPILITPSGTPTALSGVNTLYSDTGDTTVSGREDPAHTIKTLTDRITALEAKQAETQAAVLSSGSNV